ncbi:hypothetical protein ABT369_28625 [Dactylosporangium sp. NPDC000244]|uniref:hypothetical protein n=1 Tax=Dactylosporangium sp. NPDC000244 TaxID=3154365 RepID=UPI00333359D0
MTPMQLVKQMRLDECHRRLTDPGQRAVPVFAIAAQWRVPPPRPVREGLPAGVRGLADRRPARGRLIVVSDDPPPPAQHVRVDVTVTLHRRLGWLLAVALGGLPVPDLVVRLAGLILRAARDR